MQKWWEEHYAPNVYGNNYNTVSHLQMSIGKCALILHIFLNMLMLNLLSTNLIYCLLGAPIIMSSPHFYQADENFVDDVFGMKPQKEQHETTIDINPVGITL